MPVEGVVFATCILCGRCTLVMGLYANYPIALAPGMSLNAYFTYFRLPWHACAVATALGVIFFSGVLFLLLTVTRVREQIVNGIPECLTFDRGGIGMFIAFVGLRNAKLVVANPATFVSLGALPIPRRNWRAWTGDHADPDDTEGHRGNLDRNILATTVFGILRGMARWPPQSFRCRILRRHGCNWT